MPFQEPGLFEVKLTLFLGNTLVSSHYKNYIDELDIRGDETILDYGSGSGVCSRHLAQRLIKEGGHLTCVDVSHVWIEVIQKTLKKFPNIDYKFGHIQDVDIQSESYDAIFIHFVLHDIVHAERLEIMKHLVPKLKKGGKLFLREPTDWGITEDEINHIIQDSRLTLLSHKFTHTWFTGPLYQAVCLK